MMNTKPQITEEKAFDQDVKTMSYEELMETIRYLDDERCKLSREIEQDNDKKTDNKNKNLKKAA